MTKLWPMGLLFIKTPVTQYMYSYKNDFSGAFDDLHQSLLVDSVPVSVQVGLSASPSFLMIGIVTSAFVMTNISLNIGRSRQKAGVTRRACGMRSVYVILGGIFVHT